MLKNYTEYNRDINDLILNGLLVFPSIITTSAES